MSRKTGKQAKPGIRRQQLIIYGLIAIIVLLQYPLWVGSGSVIRVWQLRQQIQQQQQENAALQRRNRLLEAEVRDLKKGMAAIEERARTELGMIRKGETFYHVVDPEKNVKSSGKKR